MHSEIQEIQARVEGESAFVRRLTDQMAAVIVGQKYLVERLLIGILSNGHILIEGVPGLAKTLSVHTLASAIQAKFQRLQFTPDLLPADLIGTMIYNPQTAAFSVKKGPVFANIILADEINRAPAKVQSALLEAMQERQVTIGETTFPLEEPFLVLATQNPIEQEGTYPLPEAQIDRFMLMLKIGYPTPAEEREIMERNTGMGTARVEKVVTPGDILQARQVVRSIYVDDKVKDYIVNIIFATREPQKYGLGELKDLIAFGASPRATIYLNLAAKAHAFLRGRGYITPEDIKAIGHDVLRHRVLLTYEAEAEEVTSDDVVTKVFDAVEVP
ncbi:MAG TPA: MoxR family ATPase [candidate division Zixibacteria bacterium]|nr:MoxR family ATPase [candidate division Zixibacteria bacterium]MDD4918054.1 MoxR family ATPase [candidate division Zixibacteria bacterium]MDM7971988.1 MoxR family ATPase [candidate division Zixibacteria bacterium]HOD67426.1 MoxR family ATPase [candidate division Zixibacteria bacterium]HPM37428.1 MoxR family ATPase [candidate division Zixibacteria bacterium]